MTSQPGLRLAVDIGGTFTDTVLARPDGYVCATNKVPTTPDNPTLGALAGARRALQDAGAGFGDITGFVHGTTLATNALIERRGACVATLTSEGFRDILDIGYERRYAQYDINIDKPDLIVPRARAFTVPGRLNVRGQEIAPLDLSGLPVLVDQLIACNAEAVAICLMHSYANPDHEIRLAEALQTALPDLTLSMSHQVSPEAREFDRLCTTVANAYIQPLMARYLNAFQDEFAQAGLNCPILMMTAGGGMTELETAARLPIRLVESGPAGGAILAARIAREAGAQEVLSFDMGGTTAKLCLIDNYRAQTARHFEIARAERFIKGSGMPVRIPVVEMIEIGAGGGSIARVDRLGRLQVGPESAGSDPGPAGFAKGGTAPTVTDADIAQGLIDPGRFAEGRLTIDVNASNNAIALDIGAALELGPPEAARGVSEIVDEAMASAARMHAVESGKDLGERLMIAFGGNGPLHATRLARRAGVRHILVPRDPGVGSALGFLQAAVSFEIVRSLHTYLDTLEPGAVNAFLGTMEEEAQTVVRAGAPTSALTTRRRAFMRYHGQGHEIEIDLPEGPFTAEAIPELQARFEAEYSRLFSRAVPGMRIEILNWGLDVSAPPPPDTPATPETGSQTATPEGHRHILCDVTGAWCDVPTYAREALAPGDYLTGPALIVEAQTTTLVSADFSAKVDARGNIWMENNT